MTLCGWAEVPEERTGEVVGEGAASIAVDMQTHGRHQCHGSTTVVPWGDQQGQRQLLSGASLNLQDKLKTLQLAEAENFLDSSVETRGL